MATRSEQQPRPAGPAALNANAGPGQIPGPAVPEAAGDEKAIFLCGADEPGDRLVFGGRVLDYQARPLAKAAVIAYHTDHQGLYNPPGSSTRVPRLRGVAVTDQRGRFRFSTIRPGSYPDGSQPAHVHVAVLAPSHHVRNLEYWFEGDPLITGQRRSQAARGSDTVIVRLSRGTTGARENGGAWTFSHDIRLEGN